ncbi:MAG: macro domain-containing protein [Alkalispirochaeta sp.]
MSSEAITRHGVTVECVTGDITRQSDLDAVTNAANAQLRIGGGVAGAIHRAAGPQLDEECRPLAPIAPGEAVITGAGDLPNRHVIHTLGPVYGHDRPEATLLADCYRNSLRRAEEKHLSSIGFPAISTGAFGYPMADAARVAMETIRDTLEELQSIKLIRFVLFSDRDRQVHRRAVTAAFSESP